MVETIRQKLFEEIAQFKAEDAATLSRALELAEKIHDGQFRREKFERPEHRDPYIIHPMRVALILLQEVGLREPDPIAAALLHDVVEDSDGRITEMDIERDFDPEIAHIVALLSKPPASPDIPRHEQLTVYHDNIAAGSVDVRTVKLADRLDNMREALLTDDRKFQTRYLKETREIYIPLAAATSPFFYKALSDLCDRLEKLIRS